jgi:hypothetical protein
MPRLIGMALRWALLPFLAILAEAMASELWRAARMQGLGPGSIRNPLTLFFLAGIGFRILFRWLFQRLDRDDPLDFIDTLEHELTHALVGYLTFSPPVSLSASLKSGGEVQLKGVNPLAALAPYFLPLWSALVLLLGLVVKAGMQPHWNQFLLFLLGCFCYRLAREYRWRQTDLHLYGFLFSSVFVFLFQMLSLSVILDVRGLLSWNWVAASGNHAWQAIPGIWAWIRLRLGM